MLKFNDLTNSQKTFIVRTLEQFPEYRKQETLGAKDIHASYYKMKDSRSNNGEKLGYPNWLQNKNRVGRGTYQMPWPTDAELSSFAKGLVAQPKIKAVKTAKVKSSVKTKEVEFEKSRLQSIIDDSPVENDADYEDFNQILRENGIEV
jgi:hypothetical protein